MPTGSELATRCPFCASRLWDERGGDVTLKTRGMIKLDRAQRCYLVQCHSCRQFSPLDVDAMLRELEALPPIPEPARARSPAGVRLVVRVDKKPAP